MKYRTIYADPPWNERGAGQSVRGATDGGSRMTYFDELGLFKGAV
jgi:hypothetical protein